MSAKMPMDLMAGLASSKTAEAEPDIRDRLS